MEAIFAIVGFVYQLADFVIKGLVSYAATPDGAKEWAEVEQAALGLGLFNPASVTDDEAADKEAAHQSFLSELERIESNSVEQAAQVQTPRVTVMPPKHPRGEG